MKNRPSATRTRAPKIPYKLVFSQVFLDLCYKTFTVIRQLQEAVNLRIYLFIFY